MEFGRYTFTCRFEGEADLPPFKGSTFRGVFGVALKKIVCALKRQTCDQCPLSSQCLYTQIFETELAYGKPQHGFISAHPHPFVIVPPLTQETRFAAGEEFSCDLLLFGRFNQKLPYFIYAFQQMGTAGIGRKINGSRARFQLLSVYSGNRKIYTSSEDKIYPLQDYDRLSFPEDLPDNDEAFSIRIAFETPFRSKYHIRPETGISFEILVRTMVRRMTALLNAYGGGEPRLDYSGLIREAAEVEIRESQLQWYDWQRFSNRQNQRMPMGGIVGEAVYTGQLTRFLNLIEFCRNTHIGKQTAFGLGKINAQLEAAH